MVNRYCDVNKVVCMACWSLSKKHGNSYSRRIGQLSRSPPWLHISAKIRWSRRALCRTKLLPVTHVLVDTNFKMYLMAWNGLQAHMWHHLDSLLRHNWQYLWFWKKFFAPSLFYPSTHISTHPQRFLPVQMTGGRSLHKLWWSAQAYLDLVP